MNCTKEATILTRHINKVLYLTTVSNKVEKCKVVREYRVGLAQVFCDFPVEFCYRIVCRYFEHVILYIIFLKRRKNDIHIFQFRSFTSCHSLSQFRILYSMFTWLTNRYHELSIVTPKFLSWLIKSTVDSKILILGSCE